MVSSHRVHNERDAEGIVGNADRRSHHQLAVAQMRVGDRFRVAHERVAIGQKLYVTPTCDGRAGGASGCGRRYDTLTQYRPADNGCFTGCLLSQNVARGLQFEHELTSPLLVGTDVFGNPPPGRQCGDTEAETEFGVLRRVGLVPQRY